MDPDSREASNVLGVRFAARRFDTVVREVLEVLRGEARDGAYLCATGVHGVIEARRDPGFRRILNGAAFNVPDGQPIVLTSRLLGCRTVERAFGPDVMWAILGASAELGASHFFYGGNEGVADRLAQAAKTSFPNIGIAGTYCPPFRPLTASEENQVAAMINESGADVVWVGLSTPKQERWIAAMRDNLDVKLLCSVGAAFDYHTGSIGRAPVWMQHAALEWLYRLLQEPRRLWRRYLHIVPVFLALVALQLTGVRRFPVE